MKILIIGGNGFIGKHLKNELKEYEVYIMDNLSNSKYSSNIIIDYSNNIFNYNPDNFDTIIHLGEFSRINESFNNFDKVVDSNINGTLEVIKYCSKFNKKLIYACSSSILSDVIKDENPYIWSKQHNYELIQQYRRFNNLDCNVVFLYNVYGPGELHNEMGTFIEKCKYAFQNNLPIDIRLPGTQSRNFTHVSDIVKGIKIVLEKGTYDYQIGNENEYNITEIAKLFNLKINQIKAVKSDRNISYLDNKPLKELGWKIENNIPDYIKGIINEHKTTR